MRGGSRDQAAADGRRTAAGWRLTTRVSVRVRGLPPVARNVITARTDRLRRRSATRERRLGMSVSVAGLAPVVLARRCRSATSAPAACRPDGAEAAAGGASQPQHEPAAGVGAGAQDREGAGGLARAVSSGGSADSGGGSSVGSDTSGSKITSGSTRLSGTSLDALGDHHGRVGRGARRRSGGAVVRVAAVCRHPAVGAGAVAVNAGAP